MRKKGSLPTTRKILDSRGLSGHSPLRCFYWLLVSLVYWFGLAMGVRVLTRVPTSAALNFTSGKSYFDRKV